MFCWSLRSAPQNRADPGKQLRKRERLDQIIVCSQLKSFHTIAHTITRGKKENWRANPIAPEFRNHLPAVFMWQHDIDDKKIKFARTRLLQASLAIARKIDSEPGFEESFSQESRCFLFVFDNENPHCRKCDLFWAAKSLLLLRRGRGNHQPGQQKCDCG